MRSYNLNIGKRYKSFSLLFFLPLSGNSLGPASRGNSPLCRPENMVHHTISNSISNAPSASSNNKAMGGNSVSARHRPSVQAIGIVRKHPALAGALLAVALVLAGCGAVPTAPPDTTPPPLTPEPTPPSTAPADPAPAWPADRLAQLITQADANPLPPPLARARSLWQPVRWSELPGLQADSLHQAWNAWMRSCERPGRTWASLCRELRPLSLGNAEDQLRWMLKALQPYRVLAADGSQPEGLLTGYYEPMLTASRVRTDTHTVPLYAPPARLSSRQPWFSRQDMETRPEALAELRGREIAWLADPIDALILQIQGSGRLQIREPDGSERTVRLAFAAHNGHSYQSVGRWLLDRRAITDPSWAAIKTWAMQNPQRLNDMLWSNPRTVFFREEALAPLDAQFGPRGAQGVPLTPERSIAVDPLSIPYGTPVWLATSGPTARLQRLVLAQDTGGAIVGAVRADYFAGWGPEAAALAGGLKQPLQLWALWPREAPP